MSEQQGQAQPEKPADAYGKPISAERQAELQGFLDRWAVETDHSGRKGPFARKQGGLFGVSLTGADVSWLALGVRNAFDSVPDLHLEGANLNHSYLEGADIRYAHLESALLSYAHLEGSNLSFAHLEGANVSNAHLERTDMRNVWMDRVTQLNGAILDRASLDQVNFIGTNLAVVKWDAVTILGDEVRARSVKGDDRRRKSHQMRLDDYEAAVRAHLQLDAVMRSQGMSEQADRFAYRAQKLQRARYRLQRRPGPWLFSWVLFLLAGYGYRPARSLFWYLAIIAIFTALYMQFGHIGGQPFQFDEALVFSLTSFHGRGFFPGGLELRDLVTKFAAAEAVLGLFIEISFIATFTQRYFGNR